MQKRKPSVTGIAKLLVGCVLAAVFLYLGFRKLDWHQCFQTLSQANVAWIIAGLVSLGLDYSLRILRWWMMLRCTQPNLRLSACAGPFMSSIALNNLLPFRSGDFARVFAYSKQVGPSGVVLGTVLVERVLDLLSLLIFFFIGLQDASRKVIPSLFVKTSVYFLIGCVLLFVGLLALPWFRKPLRTIVNRSEKLKASKVTAFARSFFHGISHFQKGLLMPKLAGLSIAIWALEGGLFYCVAHSIHIDASPQTALFALGIGTLGTLLPSTPGYVGVFDYFVKMGFVSYGVSSDASAVCALLLHTILYVSLTIVGVAMLFNLRSAVTKSENPSESQEAVT